MRKILFLSVSLLLAIGMRAQNDTGYVGMVPQFFDYVAPTARRAPEILNNYSSAQRWGLRAAEYPLPSLELNFSYGSRFPVSGNSYRMADAYGVDFSVTPWQFRLSPRKRSFFHGGWTIGTYGNFLPEYVSTQLVWFSDPDNPNSRYGTDYPRDNPQWGYGYEVGLVMRMPLAWTFLPKRPNAGIWTIGLEPEIRMGYLNTKGIYALYDPTLKFHLYDGFNVDLALNAFVQYRKDNWSVKARVGFPLLIRDRAFTASLSVGYHL